jgi:chromosome partitioning protein
MAQQELVGLAEIAALAGVSEQAVANWRLRYDHFPKPLQQLHSGPVWNRKAVDAWVKVFKFEPPRDCRRLQLLKRWSHDKQDDEQILT